MGRGGGVQGGRAPSQAAYYVALAGVAVLLLMLCCYFLYFCITKINELSEHESLCGAPAARSQQATPRRDGYPVQPVVRDSATAMAKICKELPSAGSGSSRSTAFPATAPALAERPAGRGGSAASGSDAATLSDDTATTGVGAESPPPAGR